ncbi:FadR/GntR family transcriptional regulator [Niallia sp. Krafla_26]|uniref:FadR/GntR family transcriptional regulator n=1 Tax=Niallia sp. Krafla_26 TaxID=3064703 RepID=UPI003D165EF6
MKTTKINRQKIYEVIAEQIKQQIIDGDLKPGDRLPTGKELCEMYGVGRSTVREALSALEIMGLIETRQGEGSTVKTWNPEIMALPNFQDFLISEETVLELMEARKSLEISISRMAAIKRTEEDLNKLEDNLKYMELNLSNPNESKKTDMLFHKLLAQSTQNSIMVHLIEAISDQMDKAMEEIRRITFGSPSLSRKILKEHRAIYQAVVEQNTALAQQKMLDHLGHFEGEMGEYYKSKKELKEMEKRGKF